MERFKANDLIYCRGVIRRIVKAYKRFYYWEYPDLEQSDEKNLFDSRNSNDPLLEWWRKIGEYDRVTGRISGMERVPNINFEDFQKLLPNIKFVEE